MRWLVPCLNTPTFERAFAEAARLAQSGDHLSVAAPVVVPGDLPVDVDAGTIWKAVCAAERRLFHARSVAESLMPPAVTVAFLRVQARDTAGAIVAGALYTRADRILLAPHAGIRAALSARLGTLAAVRRQAPCAVQVVGMASEGMRHDGRIASEAVAGAADIFAELRTIAVNPAVHRSDLENRAHASEEQHAS